MRVTIIGTAFLLLLLLNGSEGKSVSKRHVRRDWLVIPDTIMYYIYTAVDYVSPEGGKVLVEMFESDPVQNARSLLMEKTSLLNRMAEEYYQKITEFLNEKKWFA